MCRYRKRQSSLHAAGISFFTGVSMKASIHGKIHDRIELARDLKARFMPRMAPLR